MNCSISEEQYRLLYELKTAFRNVTVGENGNDPLFRLDDERSILAKQGAFYVLDKDGNTLSQISMDRFAHRPSVVLHEIMDS